MGDCAISNMAHCAWSVRLWPSARCCCAWSPHLIRPMRFVVPPPPDLYSVLRLRLGLFLYDRLGGREILPATRTLDLTHHLVGTPLKRRYRFGFEYSDCWRRRRTSGHSQRRRRGRAGCGHSDPDPLCADGAGRILASYPQYQGSARRWSPPAFSSMQLVRGSRASPKPVLRVPAPGRVRLDKGSHIVVPRLFEHDRGYLLQTSDRRVVFCGFPFEHDFTMIGTNRRRLCRRPGLRGADPGRDQLSLRQL